LIEKDGIVYAEPIAEIIYVRLVEPTDDYKLILTFSNREIKIYDAIALLDKKIYSPLKNKKFFKRAYVSHGTVAWNDRIDIAPENLYNNSIPVKRKSNIKKKVSGKYEIDTTICNGFAEPEEG